MTEKLKVKETDISAKIFKDIISNDNVLWAARQNSGSFRPGMWFYSILFKGLDFRYHSGMPDIHGQLEDGRWFGIEVKSKSGEITAAQTLFHKRAINTTIIRSFDEYKKWFSDLLSKR